MSNKRQMRLTVCLSETDRGRRDIEQLVHVCLRQFVKDRNHVREVHPALCLSCLLIWGLQACTLHTRQLLAPIAQPYLCVRTVHLQYV